MSSEVRKAIAEILESAKQPGSPNGNAYNVEKFREDIIEYLEFIDSEFASDPELKDKSHWNLVMDDGEPDSDGFFAVSIIRPDALEIIAGTGGSDDVREICAEFSITQPNKFRKALAAKFPCKTLKIARADAEQWLGRGLGLNDAPAEH